MILVDSNIVLYVIDSDSTWKDWSLAQLRHRSQVDDLFLNSIVYAEISSRFFSPAHIDRQLENLAISFMPMPREAAFLAGQTFVQYRRQSGPRTRILPDFFLGSHAHVLGAAILTRDTRRYSAYFPQVRLIAP